MTRTLQDLVGRQILSVARIDAEQIEMIVMENDKFPRETVIIGADYQVSMCLLGRVERVVVDETRVELE